MAAKGERDAVTGVETTGHEWDGIRELNNPLPRWWVYTFYVTIVFSVVWWILFPSWPWTSGYLPGLIGGNQRLDFERRYDAARVAQAQWTDQIAAPGCGGDSGQSGAGAVRHRRRREGLQDQLRALPRPGRRRPGLLPDAGRRRLDLGRTIDQIEHTIRHGIRNGVDPDARDNAMPAFGADGLPGQGADRGRDPVRPVPDPAPER